MFKRLWSRQPAAHGKLYVIYYGWLTSDAAGVPNHLAQRIAAARPQALVAMFYTLQPKFMNLSPQVRELLHAAGVQLFAYVPLGYGTREPRSALADALHYLDNQADGIFYDEAESRVERAKAGYYQQLHAAVKERGKTVIMNSGVAATDESLMSVADILMVEHQWRAFSKACAWRRKYAPERFMGDSSNEPGAAQYLQHAIDGNRAAQETREAWASGIGWHYSTDRYTELPAWLPDYARTLADGSAV